MSENNTNTKKATHGATKARVWSITINNPTTQECAEWDALTALPWVKETRGQVEQGQNGTIHIQGMLRTDNVRFSQVKRALPRAHIEPARNATALARYVEKSDTRVESLPTRQNTTPVATAKDLQRTLLRVVVNDLYPRWPYPNDPDNDPVWEDLEQRVRHAIHTMDEFNMKHKSKKGYAECMLERAVNSLIRSGYFSVEFTVANPVIRRAFKDHFISILYREYHATQVQTDAQNRQAIIPTQTIQNPID